MPPSPPRLASPRVAGVLAIAGLCASFALGAGAGCGEDEPGLPEGFGEPPGHHHHEHGQEGHVHREPAPMALRASEALCDVACGNLATLSEVEAKRALADDPRMARRSPEEQAEGDTLTAQLVDQVRKECRLACAARATTSQAECLRDAPSLVAAERCLPE